MYLLLFTTVAVISYLVSIVTSVYMPTVMFHTDFFIHCLQLFNLFIQFTCAVAQLPALESFVAPTINLLDHDFLMGLWSLNFIGPR